MLNTILAVWSAITTVFSIWQLLEARKHAERNKAQVKIWMHWAQGIQVALQRIVSDNANGRYSSTNDVTNTVFSLEGIAFSLRQSLFEERLYTEEEYKKEQMEIIDEVKKERVEKNSQGKINNHQKK